MKLTREEAKKKAQRIAEYKAQLNDLYKEGYDKTDNENIGFRFNASQTLMSEQVSIIASFITKEQDELDHAEIVDELEIPEDVIGVGDNVTMLMQFEGEEPEERTLMVSDEKIVDMPAVTTASPIGLAIYGKKVGSTVSCITPIGKLTITILEKTHGLVR